MNLLIYGAMFSFALIGFWWNVRRRKQSSLYAVIVVVLFVLAVISRKTGYFTYSDLGSYIWRYANNDNAYFGKAYGVLTNIIRSLFGPSANAYLGSIAMIVASMSIVSIIVWDQSNKLCYDDHREDKLPVYLNTFLLVFFTYWGVAFSAEVVRTGIAITFSMVGLAYARRKTLLPCIVFCLLAIAFHWTEAFFVPIIILLYIGKDNNEKNVNTTKMYLWLFLLVVFDLMDVSSFLARLLNGILGLILSRLSQYEHYLTYIKYRQRPSVLSYVSIQYIYYRILAAYLVYIHNKSYSSKTLLYSYYIGLTIFTVMSDFGAVTRMQWIFTAPSVFLLYDYAKSDIGLRSNKLITIGGLSLLQAVMAINYLGYHF